MSTEQITPERIAEIEESIEFAEMEGFLVENEIARELFDALTASRAEVQRLTSEQSIRACECSPDEDCKHVRRAEAAEREVQRLTEKARRSDAGRVEVPDLPGHVWASAHDADSRDQCISEVRDWYRDWIFSHLSRLSSPQPATGAGGLPDFTDGEVIRKAVEMGVQIGKGLPQPSADVVDASSSWAARFTSLTAEERLFVLRCGVGGSGKYAASPSTGSDGRGLWDAPERLGLLVCVGSFAWDAPGFLEGIASLAGLPPASADVVVPKRILAEMLTHANNCTCEGGGIWTESEAVSLLDTFRSSTNHDAQDAGEGR